MDTYQCQVCGRTFTAANTGENFDYPHYIEFREDHVNRMYLPPILIEKGN